MPVVNPSISDVHINGPLNNISLAFIQEDENFVADKVFQNLPVPKKSDAYFTYDRGEWNRDEMKERAPATESAGGVYGIENTSYLCKTRGFHRNIPEEVRDNSDDPINLDAEATRFVTLKERINREVNWVAKFLVTGNPGVIWTYVADGATTPTAPGTFDPTSSTLNKKTYWNDPSSTPIEDIRQGKRVMGESTGFRANILTLQRNVFDVLLDHPDVDDEIRTAIDEGVFIAGMTVEQRDVVTNSDRRGTMGDGYWRSREVGIDVRYQWFVGGTREPFQDGLGRKVCELVYVRDRLREVRYCGLAPDSSE